MELGASIDVLAWPPRGATAGRFAVKSCGKAHAWCAECRPEQATRQRKAPKAKKVHTKACRDCGRCDECLGLVVTERFKQCRSCGETKPLDRFARRQDTGGYRNQCMRCRNSSQISVKCGDCGQWFAKHSTNKRTLCAACRPERVRPCAECGKSFNGSPDQRRYCSATCSSAAVGKQRQAVRVDVRMAALTAYANGSTPACACCGEGVLEFLALDHIEGGGRVHRQETGGGGFYSWLKKNGYPPGFQILCHNCNMGRQLNGGVCPHDALVRELVGV